MTIKEVSQKYDLSPDTIRYYERIGLIPPVPRKPNGYNIAFVYTESTKLCKNPVKLSLKYYVNSLGEKRKVRRSLPLPDFPFFSLPKELHSLLEKHTPDLRHYKLTPCSKSDIFPLDAVSFAYSCQQLGGHVIWVDAEQSWMNSWAQTNGEKSSLVASIIMLLLIGLKRFKSNSSGQSARSCILY